MQFLKIKLRFVYAGNSLGKGKYWILPQPVFSLEYINSPKNKNLQ